MGNLKLLISCTFLGLVLCPITAFAQCTMQVTHLSGTETVGYVDLTDNCLDISNAIETIWNPYPSVTFSVGNPEVCAGNCKDVTAAFTGTPPFTLSYTTSGNPPTNLLFNCRMNPNCVFK